MTAGLFPEPEPVGGLAADRFAGMGADARRTARNAELLAEGIHPLTRIDLHDDAAPAEDRAAPGLRCGGCSMAERTDWGFWKCQRVGTAHSAATDLRLWWPACRLYRPQT